MPPRDHQHVINRFIAACQADDRVLAAFLFGSLARGDADEHSDLDLCLIASDETRDDLWAGRRAFIEQLGEPLFVEDFDGDTTVFFFLADGTEAELSMAGESRLHEVHAEPYRVLLDRTGMLEGASLPGTDVDRAEQTETLRRQVHWFWHDLSHFIAAIGRGQLWWAYGQLEVLRRYCVVLARLREDFAAEAEEYDKIDLVVPTDGLTPLQGTFVPMERGPMLQAAHAILAFFRELAPPLAREHGLTYPAALDRLTGDRLDRLDGHEEGP